MARGTLFGRASTRRRVAHIAAGGLVVGSLLTTLAGVASASTSKSTAPLSALKNPNNNGNNGNGGNNNGGGNGAAGGNNGSVKLAAAGVPATTANDPHLTCPIEIQWSGFDPAGADFTVTFTGIQPTGGSVATTGPTSGHFTGGSNTATYPLSFAGGATPNKKGEFHVGIDVTTTASTNSPDFKQKTVWATGCAAAATPPSALTLTPACSSTAGQATWVVGNPAGNPTVDTLVIAAGTTVAAAPTSSPLASGLTATVLNGGDTASFTTAAPLPAGTDLYASGLAPDGTTQVASAPTPFTSTCTNGDATVGNVGFADTCSGVDATFTSASGHVTTFSVTDPNGGHSSVVGSGSRHYNVDATHKSVSVSFDGTSSNHTWSAPAAGCAGAGGQGQGSNTADPRTSGSHACKSGITVVLDNMNGTADTTFTVVGPHGNSKQVPVRAGQILKQSFPVAEDTTGTVTVTAPGLAKRTFTFAKNCTQVLGEKKTRHHHHHKSTNTPKAKKPVVQGERVTRLPFTGVDAQRALFEAAAMMLLGALLLGLGAGRRRPQVAIRR